MTNKRVLLAGGFFVGAFGLLCAGFTGAPSARVAASEGGALFLDAAGVLLLVRDKAARKREEALAAELRSQQAEFDNLKRRARIDCEEAELHALEKALKELLPPFDSLHRAVVAGQAGSEAGAAMLSGIELVEQQFLAALEKLSVQSLEPEGQPFDPRFHEALQVIHSQKVPPGSVAAVYERGYVYVPLQRLLRPAKVAVEKAQESISSDEPAMPISEAEAEATES